MNRSQHILFVTPSAYTLGGLATWLDYLVPGMRELGWDVTLGLVAGPRHHQPERYLEIHPDQQTVSIFNQTGTEQGRRHAVSRVVKQLNPDLVVTVNIPDALAAVARLREEGHTNARAVMTCHGIQHDLYADMYHLRESIDAIVCTNKLACHFAQTLGRWKMESIYHAPYGVELIDSTPLTSIDDNSCKRFTFAYVGRLEQDQKLIHSIANIVTELNKKEVNFELLIAGDGPERLQVESNLEAEVDKGSVRFLGQISPENLSEQVYSKIDALLVTSLWETGPIVIWEAMAHQVSVVSSKYVGSGKESLLHDGNNCLMFEIGNSKQAAEALIRLSSDPSLRRRIGVEGFRTVEDKLTKEKSIKNWASIFNKILLQPTTKVSQLTPGKIRTGRLAKVLNDDWAEWIRERAGTMGPDSGPGGEWPHCLSGFPLPGHFPNEAEFWKLAMHSDTREVAP